MLINDLKRETFVLCSLINSSGCFISKFGGLKVLIFLFKNTNQ
jgi:hypothetical protein